MALTRVDTGLQSFPDFNRNQQLANAQIYIGVPGLDPAVLANQYQAYVVQENGTQVPVPQPIRTSAGGVPTYNGSPVQIAVAETAYSVKVLSATGSQIYYQLNNTDLALIDAAQVSYTPAGTGAVATTVERKLQELVSVKDSGADPTGATDSTAAIQAVIDANPGKWVTGDGGTYAIDLSVILKNKTRLCDITFNLTGTNANYGVAAIYNENWNDTAGNIDIQIENVSIIGINTVQQSDATVITPANKGVGGIYLGYVSNSSVKDCYVQDSWSGIVVTQTPAGTSLYEANNLVENCKIVRSQAWSQTGNPGRPRGILFLCGGKVSNCEVIDSGTGFYVGDASGATIDSCRAFNWFIDDGFYVLGNDLRVTNCLAYGNNFGSGFAVAYNERSCIANNTAIDCGNMGFRIHVPQSRTQFIGNTAKGCGYGFRVDNTARPYPEVCDGLIVQGNIAETCLLVGFQFQQIQNSVITGNIARNNNQSGVTLPTRGGIALYAYSIRNRLSDNQCYDDQGVVTQTFGLYVYPASESGASIENTGNSIDHKSINGTDFFGPLAANVGRGFTENGSWTPVVSFTTTPGTQAYAQQVGRYLRVGNMVTLFATIVLSAKDAAAAGNLRITGMPFTPVTLSNYIAVGTCMTANLDFAAGYTVANSYIQTADSNIFIFQSGDNVALQQFAAAAVANNTAFYITITYQAA